MADNNKIREEVKALTERLETGIQDLYTSDKYMAYLDTLSKFHRYSIRNTVLIHLQMPDASHVAGFNKWKNEFERHVMKGQKGIRIFAPAPFIVKKEMEKLDPDTQAPVLDKDGMAVVEEVEMTIPAFKPVSVFDVSQTDGKPLPSLAEDLIGDVRQYEAFMDALKAVSVMPIGMEALDPDTDGVCRYDSRTIAIREGMSEIQTVAAVVHEMTHAELHDYNQQLEAQEQEDAGREDAADQEGEEPAPKPRSRRAEEVEAESVSYVVCQHYGIETGANSFGYIAHWSKDRELNELKASLEIIRKTAASMIDRIDGQFAEICKERGIDLTPAQDAPEQTAEAPARETEPATVTPEQAASEPEVAAPSRKYFITERQREQAERMAAKWEARAEAFYAGGEGWGFDTAGYCKSPEEAEQAEGRAASIHHAIDSLMSGNGAWADVLVIQQAVSDRDELDAQVAINQDLRGSEAITPELTENDTQTVLIYRTEDEQHYSLEKIDNHGRYDDNAVCSSRYYELPADFYVEKAHGHLQVRQRGTGNQVEILRGQGDMPDLAVFHNPGTSEYQRIPLKQAVELERPQEQAAPSSPETEPATVSENAAMRPTDLQQKGLEIARRYENRPLQDRINIIAETFGCKTASIRTTPCTGKWRGTSDISLDLDNGASLFIGNHRTPQAKTARVQNECVNGTLASYNPEILAEIKARTVPALLKREAEDNAIAAQKGLKPYTFLNIEMNDGSDKQSGGYIGWYYATVAVDGKIFALVETGLNYDIARGVLSESRPNYFVAGALKENEADFVYNNVGHSSTSGLYKIHLSDKARERAEKTLNERIAERREPTAPERPAPAKPDPIQEADKFIEDIGGIGNLFGAPTPAPKPEKQYELGFGHMGNGLTVWNRREEKNGDYVTVAHIDPDRSVTFYDKDMPDSVKARIEDMARTSNMTVSATQDAPVFTKPAQEKESDRQEETFDITFWNTGVEIEAIHYYNEDNDYETLAYISYDRSVEFAETDLPHEIKERIIAFAQTTEKGQSVADIGESEVPTVNEPDENAPDLSISLSERDLYGYKDPAILPLLHDRALELYDADHTIYMLHPDGTEEMAFDRADIENHDGIFGIEAEEWQASQEFQDMAATVKDREASKEAALIYGKEDTYGIYQLKGGDKTRDYRWESLASLEARGLSVDRANYELVYTAPLTGNDTLDSIYEKLNIDRPPDFSGHTLSMSDIIVFQQGGEIKSHYVDSSEIKELPTFLGHEKQPELAATEVERWENDHIADVTVSTPPPVTGPTVAELEAQVNAGQQISLFDLAKAVKNEPPKTPGRKPPAHSSKKEKPSILAQLQEAKKAAAQGREPDKSAPKRNSDREV